MPSRTLTESWRATLWANGVLHNKGSGSTALPRAPQQAPAIAALPHPRSSSNRYRFAPASLLNEHSLLLCSRFSAQRASMRERRAPASPLNEPIRERGAPASPLNEHTGALRSRIPRSTRIRERCATASPLNEHKAASSSGRANKWEDSQRSRIVLWTSKWDLGLRSRDRVRCHCLRDRRRQNEACGRDVGQGRARLMSTWAAAEP